MTARAAIVVLFLFISSARAQLSQFRDDLSEAYKAAISDLSGGKDRQGIVDRLKPVLDKNPASPYAPIAIPFLKDLAASAKNPPAGPSDPPETKLAESRIQFIVLGSPPSWDGMLKEYVTYQPTDPCAQLASADREVIARLIPLLSDRSPARCDASSIFQEVKPQARVCDLALALIQYHGKVLFHRDTRHGTFLHQLPDAELTQVAERVATWWEEVKDKSIAAGVRAQLTHDGWSAESVWMAKTLARLGEGQETDDREFALNILRGMLTQSRGQYLSISAANALAEFGDFTALDIFYEAWKSSLDRPGLIYQPEIVFYLSKHGGRREWELLYAITLLEIRTNKRIEEGTVWAHAVSSEQAGTNPYAIPLLGIVLDQTREVGSRSVGNAPAQVISFADDACEKIQKQIGQDFGYRFDNMLSDRLAAIKRARAWWETEGITKYTFDYIEKEIVPGKVLPIREPK